MKKYKIESNYDVFLYFIYLFIIEVYYIYLYKLI